jgi:hypothetical protein
MNIVKFASRVNVWPWVLMALAGVQCSAWAKLPPPSAEAKAKADEAAAKTAHQGKVDAFLLCKSMDKVAARYQAEARKAGKAAKPTAGLAACADPGKFVYTPPPAAPAVATAAAPAAAAQPPIPAKK